MKFSHLFVFFFALSFTVSSRTATGQVRLKPYAQKTAEIHPLNYQSAPKALFETPPPARDGEVTAEARSGDVVWQGTRKGLIRVDKRAAKRDQVQYFASKRWLADDHVVAVVADKDGAWVRTQTGISRIEYKMMTLADKARMFERRVVERHDRHGMVADSALRRPGDLSSNEKVSNDNDGLWTAMYAAAKCYEYAVTKSPEALARAKKATEAVLYLEEVTGRPGFPARSYIKPGETQPKDGFWYDGKDGIRWKADTSSDEIVGHFYIFAIAHDLLPDEASKERIRATAKRIMDHILQNNYYLVDVTGKPTRWGRWHPEYFASETGKPDAPLNAAELLMFLKVTHHLTGEERYQKEYLKAAHEMGYAKMTARYLELQEELNYSDEELALLSFHPLFLYEKDEALLKIYRDGLEQWWKNIQRELNPLWTFIYKVANPQSKPDMEGGVWTLQRIPMDLVRWTVSNSHRTGLTKVPELDRHKRPEVVELLPADERPVMKWNGNPFVVDGGCGGCSEDDGAFFLLPYWMGRYHRFLIGE